MESTDNKHPNKQGFVVMLDKDEGEGEVATRPESWLWSIPDLHFLYVHGSQGSQARLLLPP